MNKNFVLLGCLLLLAVVAVNAQLSNMSVESGTSVTGSSTITWKMLPGVPDCNVSLAASNGTVVYTNTKTNVLNSTSWNITLDVSNMADRTGYSLNFTCFNGTAATLMRSNISTSLTVDNSVPSLSALVPAASQTMTDYDFTSSLTSSTNGASACSVYIDGQNRTMTFSGTSASVALTGIRNGNYEATFNCNDGTNNTAQTVQFNVLKSGTRAGGGGVVIPGQQTLSVAPSGEVVPSQAPSSGGVSGTRVAKVAVTAVAGAIAGSVVPGIGNIIGAVVGAALGFFW